MRKGKSSARVMLAAALGVAVAYAEVGMPGKEGATEKESTSITEGPQDMEQAGKEGSPEKGGEFSPITLSGAQVAEICQLKDRAEKRWGALVKRDFTTAYSYETPEYRKETSAKRFGAHFGAQARWHMATVSEVRYDRSDEATVSIALDFSFDLPTDETARTTSFIKEQWVRVDGTWWHRDDRQPLGGGNHSQPSQRK